MLSISTSMRELIATGLFLGTVVVVLFTVRASIRGAKPSGKTRESDRPDLILGPQELPEQGVPGERKKGSGLRD